MIFSESAKVRHRDGGLGPNRGKGKYSSAAYFNRDSLTETDLRARSLLKNRKLAYNKTIRG